MNRGILHTIEHYEITIQRFKTSGNTHLISFVSAMERTLVGLKRIAK